MTPGAALEVVLECWRLEYGLSPSEISLLRLTCCGVVGRVGLCASRGVKPSTVKKQVQNLCRKTEFGSLDRAAVAVMTQALALVCDPESPEVLYPETLR